MKILNMISKRQLVPLRFMQGGVAASQTAIALYIAETSAGAANVVGEVYMPWEGEIVGISYELNAAGTVGSLTVSATVNGTVNANTTQTITTGIRGGVKVPRGQASFAAAQYIGVKITTDGTWDGTSSDLVVTVWVMVKLRDI
jgi:hypothetical protein